MHFKTNISFVRTRCKKIYIATIDIEGFRIKIFPYIKNALHRLQKRWRCNSGRSSGYHKTSKLSRIDRAFAFVHIYIGVTQAALTNEEKYLNFK
jgi:hypothetical protein